LLEQPIVDAFSALARYVTLPDDNGFVERPEIEVDDNLLLISRQQHSEFAKFMRPLMQLLNQQHEQRQHCAAMSIAAVLRASSINVGRSTFFACRLPITLFVYSLFLFLLVKRQSIRIAQRLLDADTVCADLARPGFILQFHNLNKIDQFLHRKSYFP
jgi:hypothetical protein